MDGGQVASNGSQTITLPENTMALSNNGDDVHLVDPQGRAVHHVRYTAAQARSGQEVKFR